MIGVQNLVTKQMIFVESIFHLISGVQAITILVYSYSNSLVFI